MSTTLSRRALLSGLAALGAAPAFAEAPGTSLRPVARPETLGDPLGAATIIERAGLRGVTSAMLAELDGTPVESTAPDAPLPPASVAKALTALYARDALGPDHRFETRLIATGPVVAGRVQGDLVLVGGGDPLLDTDHLGDMAGALAGLGVTGIDGRFLVDEGALPALPRIDPAQPPQVGYNPGVSGLNLNFNRVYFEWRRQGEGYTTVMDARGGRFQPQVGHAVMVLRDTPGPVYTYRALPDREVWTVARGALGDGGSRWLPVRQPGLYAGDVFRTLCAGRGIALPPARRGGGEGDTLARHVSEPLDEIVRSMLRFSTNVTAEALGLAATAARGGAPRTLADSGAAMSDWLRATYGAQTAMVDHSGLGDASRVTAAALVRVLAGAATDPTFALLLRDHPIRDEGRRVIADPPFDVSAKTGTLNFVSTLAGYHERADGPPRAFAILSADLERRAGLERSERERPEGGRAWATQARRLQQRLLRHWDDIPTG
ncbi:MAG: D-alanyl-D-alanine carboxypeptidase/D-alanyl-D-alanine endopeptidase [Shimia sp.]